MPEQPSCAERFSREKDARSSKKFNTQCKALSVLSHLRAALWRSFWQFAAPALPGWGLSPLATTIVWCPRDGLSGSVEAGMQQVGVGNFKARGVLV